MEENTYLVWDARQPEEQPWKYTGEHELSKGLVRLFAQESDRQLGISIEDA